MKMQATLGVTCAILAAVMINEHLRSAEAYAPEVTISRLPEIKTCEMVPVTQNLTWACQQLQIQGACAGDEACLIVNGAAI